MALPAVHPRSCQLGTGRAKICRFASSAVNYISTTDGHAIKWQTTTRRYTTIATETQKQTQTNMQITDFGDKFMQNYVESFRLDIRRPILAFKPLLLLSQTSRQ